jgi:hypothetical protein
MNQEDFVSVHKLAGLVMKRLKVTIGAVLANGDSVHSDSSRKALESV